MQRELTKSNLVVEKPHSKVVSFIAPVIALIIIIAVWEAVISAFQIPSWMIPTPTAIGQAFVSSFGTELWPNFLVTLQEILSGYIIVIPVGIVLAILMTQFPVVNSALSPYVILCVTTPLVTLVPLLIVLIGYGFQVKLIAVILQSFSIIMMNAATGFNNVDPLKIELMQTLGAKRTERLRYVIIPSAMSNIFTGIRLGGIFATIAAISAEFSGGSEGLGFVIMKSTTLIKMDVAFAAILMIALIGIVLYLLVSFVEKKVVKWKI